MSEEDITSNSDHPFLFPEELTTQVEFSEILREISNFCSSHPATIRLNQVVFSYDNSLIRHELALVKELKDYFLAHPAFIINDFSDLSDKMKMLAFEGFILQKEELSALMFFLKNYFIIVNAVEKDKDIIPLIKDFFDKITIEKKCLHLLEKIFDDSGEIKDESSPKLLKIRKELKITEKQTDIEFEKILHTARKNDWLSDEEQSIRSGRQVIAIKSKYKKNLPGIVVDESGSGKTLFVQPYMLIELENRINRLKQEENNEINHIIREICTKLSPYANTLAEYYNQFILFDIMTAKARFAIKYNCNTPVLSDIPVLNIVNAYHPVLLIKNSARGKKTIPLNLNLSEQERIMIISGPNAGGKTIALKTLVLLQLMLMASIPVPAENQSEIYIFRKIITDFGDNQSLDESLSTYSAKLRTYKLLLNSADQHTLFLLDEFGSGTEPQIGGAVAEAILEKLLQTRAFGAVSTHHSNLKTLAAKTSGVLNAAMLFDQNSLSPLYVLETGKAGSSFTLEILTQSGFDHELISTIKNKSANQVIEYDNLLRELNIEKQKTQELKRKYDASLYESARLLTEYRRIRDEIKSRSLLIREKSRENTENYLNNLKKNFEKMIQEWKQEKSEEKKILKAKEIFAKIEEKRKKNRKLPEKYTNKNQIKEEIKTGDYVKIIGQNQVGMVESINKGIASLVFENQKIKISIQQLEKTGNQKNDNKTSHTVIKSVSGNDIPLLEIDVRGMRKNDALELLEKFIDNALLHKFSNLRIIHGIGEGILKKAIHEKLKQYTFVNKISSERPELGGEGVTLVEIN